MVIKHHMAWHLAERAQHNGNPRFSWTYLDESENRAIEWIYVARTGNQRKSGLELGGMDVVSV